MRNRKNNAPEKGKTTLLGNSIRQAFASKYIKRVIVSTESTKIAKEALKNNYTTV